MHEYYFFFSLIKLRNRMKRKYPSGSQKREAGLEKKMGETQIAEES